MDSNDELPDEDVTVEEFDAMLDEGELVEIVSRVPQGWWGKIVSVPNTFGGFSAARVMPASGTLTQDGRMVGTVL